MKSVLITGANRGLGLGMVNYLIKQNKATNVFATCRKASEELNQLAQENKHLHILKLEIPEFVARIGPFLPPILLAPQILDLLDLSYLNSFNDVSSQISQVVGPAGLNLLMNNAGIATKFTKLHMVKAEQLLDNLTVNTVAPIMLTKSLLPLLKQAAESNSDKPIGSQRAVVINISSLLGSIAQNDKGGFYPYRCSKAALNAATKSMSIDLKKDNILVASIHPGWVKTDMGGKGAPLDVPTSISEIFATIDKLGEEDSGKFLQYDGSELPW